MEVGTESCQFILKGVRDDGVKSGAEVYKQDPHISPWSVQMLQDEVQSHVDCIIHRPVCSVGKLQGVLQLELLNYIIKYNIELLNIYTFLNDYKLS